jgi:DNA-binding beta-propeller fold protein YncE
VVGLTGARSTERGKPSGMKRHVVSTVTALVAVLGLLPTGARADTGTPPTWVEDIGGPGHAQMYPSGIEIDARDGAVVVADTGNDQVARYGAGGTLQWSVGGFGAGTGRFNDPRDVGVDSAGNVYVADTGNVRIAKLSPSGAWITSWKAAGADKIGTPMGVTVSDDLVYVADASKRKVRVYDTGGNHIRSFGEQGACTFSALRDVDADAAGNVYVANYLKNNILKMSATGTCLRSWGTKGAGPGQFKNPYGVRVATDPVLGAEGVYVADSNNNRIQEFTTTGAFVAQMGSTGDDTQPGTFGGLRRVAVGPGGDAWGADLWGWRAERFDRSAGGFTYAQTIGAPPPLPPFSSQNVFNELRQVSIAPDGDLIAIDTVNQRFVVIDGSTEMPTSACGKRGWMPGSFNWPRGLGVDPATGQIWVVDTKQSQIQIMRRDCTALATLGSLGSSLDRFNYPYSIAIRASDGIAWIADSKNNRVVSYDVSTRTPLAAFGTLGSGSGAFNKPSGIAIDPVSGHVLVADRSNNRIVELTDTGGKQISVVRTLTGGFHRPEGVAVDAAGRIYVADTNDHQVVVLNPNGTIKATMTGHGTGFLYPSSITVDPAGRILVSDTYHDRIQVYTY